MNRKIINDVRPLSAWHYNPDKVKNIGGCFSPPYDVISPQMQDAYYAGHPYNFVRLILNKQQPGDNEQNNPYTRAAALQSDWEEQEILIHSLTPAFWVYTMEYDLPDVGKKSLQGFIGLVRLADFEEKRILPHEKILKGPYEDRIKLTQATKTQLEYIWGIYPDREFSVNSQLKDCIQQPPLIDHQDRATMVRHKLWKLTESGKIKQISRLFEEKQIFIADGHHRYNTMLTIREIMRKQYPDAGGNAPWEYMLMYLTSSADQGLIVRPTHRMLHNLPSFDEEKIHEKLAAHFQLSLLPGHEINEENIEQWVKNIEDCPPESKQMGLYLPGGKYYILKLTDPQAYLDQSGSTQSDESKMLDVNILNNLLLKKILGISEEQLALNTNIKYTVDPGEAVRKVEQGQMQLAFILNSTSLQSVIDISLVGEVMPRKSTYFFPKPISGLVIYEMKV